MATIIRRSNKYQAQIRRAGFSASKTFLKRSDATQWARKIESEMERGLYIETSNLADQTSLSTLLDQYKDNVLPFKKGRDIEVYRIATFRQHLGDIRLSQLRPHIITTYRDNRLKTVKPSTVKRELGLLSRILSSAEKEFGIPLPQGNPVARITLPKEAASRERRPTTKELNLLLQDNTIGELAAFAIETGMRRGEITAIEWKHINWKNSTLLIPATKTGIVLSSYFTVSNSSLLIPIAFNTLCFGAKSAFFSIASTGGTRHEAVNHTTFASVFTTSARVHRKFKFRL